MDGLRATAGVRYEDAVQSVLPIGGRSGHWANALPAVKKAAPATKAAAKKAPATTAAADETTEEKA